MLLSIRPKRREIVCDSLAGSADNPHMADWKWTRAIILRGATTLKWSGWSVLWCFRFPTALESSSLASYAKSNGYSFHCECGRTCPLAVFVESKILVEKSFSSTTLNYIFTICLVRGASARTWAFLTPISRHVAPYLQPTLSLGSPSRSLQSAEDFSGSAKDSDCFH